MTIPSSASEISHAGNGVSLAFPIPFVFDSAADLKITRTDSAGNVAVLTTGFVVSGGGGFAGTITFSVAPTADVDIAIYDNPEIKQATDYVSNDPFPAESHERALDRLTRIAKRLAQQVRRSLRVPDGDPITDLTLGSVDNRKGKFLFFNAVTGAIEYAVGIAVQALSQSIIAQLLNPQSPTEIAQGYVPTFYTYRTSPKYDVRRAFTDSHWDDGTVQSGALLKGMQIAFADKGRLILPNDFYIKAALPQFVMAGHLFNQGLAIEGPGGNGAIIEQVSPGQDVFDFTGPTPTGDPQDARLLLEGFCVRAISGGVGIRINGLANWTMRGLLVDSFNTDYQLLSALLGLMDDCGGHTASGLSIALLRNGAGSGCNRVTVRDCRFTLSKTQGIYVASGDDITFLTCQSEGNGTEGVMTTGNIRVVSTFGGEIGAGVVQFIGCRTEGAYGENILTDSNANATVVVNGGTHLAGHDTVRAIKDNGVNKLVVQNIRTGAADTIESAAGSFTFEDSVVGGVTYTGSRPYFKNVATAVTQHESAFTDSFNVTPTGVSGATAASVGVKQVGNKVVFNFGAIQWTSNTTGFGAGAVPGRYRPASGSRTFSGLFLDNSLQVARAVTIDSAGALVFGGTWTASGGKGFVGADCTPFYL